MNENDKQADKRLRKLYGITLGEYNRKLEEQGGVCGICGNPPNAKRRLAVDHNHKIAKARLFFTKLALPKMNGGNTWRVVAENYPLVHFGTRKRDLTEEITKQLKRRSIRGLLCFKCNKLILGRLERMKVRPELVIGYLKRYDPQNPLVKEL